MKQFRVWFKKIDEQAIDVEAENEREAIKMAKFIWSRKNGYPNHADIEIIKEE